MIEEVKTAFKENLPNLEWMDEDTRVAAKRKVRPCKQLFMMEYDNM